MRPLRSYDAIIAGASFAGLAVASQLRGNILLIDKKPIGTGEASACGTFFSVLRELKCEKSVLQTFERVVFHCPVEVEFELIDPLCTFDYEKFCQTLGERVKAEKIESLVRGVHDNTVVTDAGEFRSNCIVDCTGWRAILASSLIKGFVNKKQLSTGLQTVAPFRDDRLRFFVDPRIIEHGVAWVFPIGNASRIGIASYAGKTNLFPELEKFVRNLGLEIGPIYGGCIPYGLRNPVVGNIFLVG
ncbi:MAG: hypothetical protein ACPL7O_11100, partial [Armatimonadota bacterium]